MTQCKLAASIFIGASLLYSAAYAGGLDNEVLVIAAEPYAWTGYYAGLNAGILKHTLNMTDNDATSFYATIEQVSNPKFTGGFQVGYLYQLDLAPASGVFGLEFNANFSNAKFNQEYGSSFALYQLEAENELKNYYSLQFIGGLAADRALLFLAAGLSLSNISGNVSNQDGIPFFDGFSLSKKALGTTVGGGIEYALSETISVRFEVDIITPRGYTTSDEVDDDFWISNNIVRGILGVNYKFG